MQAEREVKEKRLNGIVLRRECPKLHHFFFADESLIFMQGSVKNARHLKELIMKYCRILE